MLCHERAFHGRSSNIVVTSLNFIQTFCYFLLITMFVFLPEQWSELPDLLLRVNWSPVDEIEVVRLLVAALSMHNSTSLGEIVVSEPGRWWLLQDHQSVVSTGVHSCRRGLSLLVRLPYHVNVLGVEMARFGILVIDQDVFLINLQGVGGGHLGFVMINCGLNRPRLIEIIHGDATLT